MRDQLEYSTLDDPASRLNRARVLKRMLESERRSALHMAKREAEQLMSSAERYVDPGPMDLAWVGTMGPQVDASKLNSIMSRIALIDEVLVLLEQVIKTPKDA